MKPIELQCVWIDLNSELCESIGFGHTQRRPYVNLNSELFLGSTAV